MSLTYRCFRHDVAIADGRHGDHRPPERLGDAPEPFGAVFGVVRRAGEDDHADDEEERQHEQLVEATRQRLSEDVQSLGMARQLEDAADTDDPHDAEQRDAARLLSLHGQRHVKRKDREQIQDVQKAADEPQLVGRDEKP